MEPTYYPINIYWTRHAESCANLHTNTIDDKPPKDYKSKENIGREKKPIKGGSIVTTLKGFCSYHPPLSYIGIQQAMKLSENINNIGFNFDIVLSSPLLRTIMTTMIAFRYMPDTKIQVVPFINEELNLCQGFDYQNNMPNRFVLERMANYCKKWMESDKFKYYDDITINNVLEEFVNMDKELSDIIKQYDIKSNYKIAQADGLSAQSNTQSLLDLDIFKQIESARNILKYGIINATQKNFSPELQKERYDKINILKEGIKEFILKIIDNKLKDVFSDIDKKDDCINIEDKIGKFNCVLSGNSE